MRLLLWDIDGFQKLAHEPGVIDVDYQACMREGLDRSGRVGSKIDVGTPVVAVLNDDLDFGDENAGRIHNTVSAGPIKQVTLPNHTR